MADFKRSSRVAEFLKKEISDIIRRELKDPLVGMATVSQVRLTDDLSFARIFISIIGDEKTRERSLKGLTRAQKFVRAELARRSNLRHVPDFTFVLDDSVDYAVNIEALIRKTKS